MNLLRPEFVVVAGLVALCAGVILPAQGAEAAEPQLAHAVFFTLKDQSPKSREAFIASCNKYLAGHDGTVAYTIGAIAEDVKEGASDREFDVALHVVFENKGMLAAYLKSERHDKFVAENKDKFAKVRVFDTYQVPPKPISAGR